MRSIAAVPKKAIIVAPTLGAVVVLVDAPAVRAVVVVAGAEIKIQ